MRVFERGFSKVVIKSELYTFDRFVHRSSIIVSSRTCRIAAPRTKTSFSQTRFYHYSVDGAKPIFTVQSSTALKICVRHLEMDKFEPRDAMPFVFFSERRDKTKSGELDRACMEESASPSTVKHCCQRFKHWYFCSDDEMKSV
jgi:hypothetical protein